MTVDMDVSVILPVRNCALSVTKSISSLLAQKGVTFEIIVVDANTDLVTTDVVKSFLRDSDHHILGSDQGVYAAINQGLVKASGRWIYILGGDDYLPNENTLFEFVGQADHNTLLIMGDVEYRGSSSRWLKNRHASSFGWGLLWRNTVHQQGTLYHHSLLADRRFDERYRVLSDYAFHLWLFFHSDVKAEHVKYKPEVFAICGAQGLSKRFNTALYWEEWSVKRRILPLGSGLLILPWVGLKMLLKGGVLRRNSTKLKRQ